MLSSNCSHINETVGFYQPFHDHIGCGLPIHGVFFMTEVNGCVTWEMMQMYILQLEVFNG